MKKIIKYIIILFVFYHCTSANNRVERIPDINPDTEKKIKELYHQINISDKLDYKIFQFAYVGLSYITVKNKNILTIIDYSKSSNSERFFVIDIKNKKLLYSTLVAHGRNTGNLYAKKFSNKANSKKSSLGFFITGKTYKGKHGYSLKLDGIEKNINDNARQRAIVIHGADYVSEKFIKNYTRLGRSWGCPALPVKKSKQIIDTIKNGCCIFIYGNDENYFKNYLFIEKIGVK